MRNQVWQIASGDVGRNYSPLFLAHDLMFLGPGSFGAFDDQAYDQAVAKRKVTPTKVGMIRSFARDVQPGDVVLLRKAHLVVAIGAVAPDAGNDGYQYDPTFSDVDGWDLQHTRRVLWQNQLATHLEAIQRNGDLFQAFKQQPMFTRVLDRAVLDQIAPLMPRFVDRDLKDRPKPLPPELTLEEFGQLLFSKGLANDAVDKVLSAIARQRRLLRWYYDDGKESYRPDEHEVVAHMVLPLLLALGWSEQLLAVEWHRVDLTAFWGTPTTAERCVLVCEAKGIGHGMQGVREQAVGYVDKLNLVHCGKILLTQGARFYIYERYEDGWRDEPTGYMNLEHIRTEHLAPAGTNAVDTLIALTPAGVHRPVGKQP